MAKSIVPAKKNEVSKERTGKMDLFTGLQRQMNRVFDSFFDDFNTFGMVPKKSFEFTFNPRFDVSETDDKVEVTAELPGINEKDLDVSLDDNVLTIKGEKREEKEEKKKDYHLSERSYGKFQRSVALPSSIDQDKIKAEFKKGVLHVILSKTEEAKSRRKKIAISAEK